MSSKWRYILGTTTIVAIIGGTIYAIKKSKDLENYEGESISVEEAMAEVEARRELESYREEQMYENSEEFEEVRESIRDEAGWNRSFMRAEDTKVTVGPINIDGVPTSFEVTDMEETKDSIRKVANVISFMRDDLKDNEDVYHEDPDDDDSSWEQPIISTIPEEDKVLRYEPSSAEAKNQFIRMELAEWAPSESTYGIMLELFNFPFDPTNDGDVDLRMNLKDYRAQFFGFDSKWINNISYADVILHYARTATFNCDENVRFWVEYFLEFNEIDMGTPSHVIDNLLKQLNTHKYFNEERQTFGLFGLTRESMDSAIQIANRNIDRSVTYEIEFNEFLKSCL